MIFLLQEIATAPAAVPVVVTDYSGIAAIVTAVGPTVAIIVASIVQILQLRRTKRELVSGQEGIHTLVDGASAEQKRIITALKLEVARLNRDDETELTTHQTAGEGGSSVGIDQGVVTVEKHGTERRIDDPPIPTHKENQ